MRILLFTIAIAIAGEFGYAQRPLAPSKVKFDLENHDALIIENYAYTTCIDTRLNIPIWVSHAINNELIQLGNMTRDRPEVYSRDPQFTVIKKDGYSSSGYDHGHMAPARDFKWSSAAWWESFYMTNMAPQNACLNQKGWCHIESHCRKWAGTYSDNVIYIITGIVPGKYIDTLCHTNGLNIYVPSEFFKAVLSYNRSSRDGMAIGFVLPNQDIDNSMVQEFVCTIDSIESITGLDLFSSLYNAFERQVESEIGDFEFYPNLECSQKDCDKIYSGRRFPPEERTKLNCNQ
jgi:endonuclease G